MTSTAAASAAAGGESLSNNVRLRWKVALEELFKNRGPIQMQLQLLLSFFNTIDWAQAPFLCGICFWLIGLILIILGIRFSLKRLTDEAFWGTGGEFFRGGVTHRAWRKDSETSRRVKEFLMSSDDRTRPTYRMYKAHGLYRVEEWRIRYTNKHLARKWIQVLDPWLYAANVYQTAPMLWHEPNL